jgi:hypothetical protein
MEFDSSPNRSARGVGLRPVPPHPSPLPKACLSPQVRQSFLNPNGIVASSPGLRAASYPGLRSRSVFNPERVGARCSFLVSLGPLGRVLQPFQGWGILD